MLGALMIHGLQARAPAVPAEPRVRVGADSEHVHRERGAADHEHAAGAAVHGDLKIPYPVLAPIIVVVSYIGVYGINNSVFDLWVMTVFGALGYVFKKFDYPVAPTVLALVLGELLERSLRQALAMSQNDPMIFVTRPITAIILLISILSLTSPMIRGWWRARSPMMET